MTYETACPVESALDSHMRNQERAEARYEAAERETDGTDYEAMARDWLMSDRVEDFWPNWPRTMTGTEVLNEFIGCTDSVAQVAFAKVSFGVAKPEETQLCQHKLGLLVEEYAEKFKERDVRGLV